MARLAATSQWRFWIAAICAGVLACALWAIDLGFLAPLVASFGAFFAFVAWVSGRDAKEITLTHAALQALTRGRFDEVERIHAAVPESKRRGQVGRALAIHRGMMAFYRGDPERTVRELADAVAPHDGFWEKSHLSLQRAHALGLRALAYASIGDDARAEADAAIVETIPEADAGAVGRVALARAVVLSRDGASDALAKHLSTHATLLLETAHPRERILVRALRRLARSRTKSVYREAAKRSDDVSTGAVADWVARIAPGAAAHAGEERFAKALEEAPMPEVSEAAESALAAERKRAVQDAGRATRKRIRNRLLVAIPIVLVAYSVAVWKIFEDRGTAAVEDEVATIRAGIFTNTAAGSGLAVGFLALMTGIMVHRVRQLRRQNLPLLAAHRAAARGDDDEAIRLTTPLVEKAGAIPSATGRLTLATIHERRAEFERALDEAAKAYVPFASGALRAYGTVHMIPSILALRAVSLAALGRDDEARAELGTILREHRDWANTALTDFRVRLILAVKGGDREAARAIARGRTAELPLPMRDDVLCDLVLATSGDPFSNDDRERLAGELDDDPRLRAWVDAVAPGLRDRFAAARATKPTRVALMEEEEEEVEERPEIEALSAVSKMTLREPS